MVPRNNWYVPPAVYRSYFDFYADWDRNGRWFMRLRSSGIPAHSYGQAYEPWDHLVKDQEWDITVPIDFDEDADAEGALQRGVDPTEFLVAAAKGDRPLGMALNGVPFFSPLTASGEEWFSFGICCLQQHNTSRTRHNSTNLVLTVHGVPLL